MHDNQVIDEERGSALKADALAMIGRLNLRLEDEDWDLLRAATPKRTADVVVALADVMPDKPAADPIAAHRILIDSVTTDVPGDERVYFDASRVIPQDVIQSPHLPAVVQAIHEANTLGLRSALHTLIHNLGLEVSREEYRKVADATPDQLRRATRRLALAVRPPRSLTLIRRLTLRAVLTDLPLPV